MHRKTHTDLTKQPPTVGMRRVQTVYYVCANFHPFTIITDFSASSPPRTPRPPSHPSRSFFSFLTLPLTPIPPGFSFTFHQRRRQRLRTLPPISLDRAFSRFFSPRVYPPFSPSRTLSPPTNRDSGDDGGCPEGAAISIEGRSRQFSYRTT